MNTKNITTTLALILIIAALSITSYFSYQLFLLKNNDSKNTDTVETVIVPTDFENNDTEINDIKETNTDPSNLTTYSNSEYGIEFMYPSEYTIEEVEVEYDGRLQIIMNNQNKLKDNSFTFIIDRIDNKAEENINIYFDEESVDSITLNSVNWIIFKINSTPHGGGKQISYRTIKNGKSYIFSVYNTHILNYENQLVLNSIVVK